MDVALAVQIIQLFVTAILAAFAGVIAWRQSETARAKLRLDLFERRFRVYRGVMDLLAVTVHEARVPCDALDKFYRATDEKRFLFNYEITEYLKDLRDQVFELGSAEEMIDGMGDDREAARNAASAAGNRWSE